MNSYSDELKSLVAQLTTRERDAAVLRGLMANGGRYRLVITFDHPNEDVREIVAGAAQEFAPLDTIMAGLVQSAEAARDEVKRAIHQRVSREVPPVIPRLSTAQSGGLA